MVNRIQLKINFNFRGPSYLQWTDWGQLFGNIGGNLSSRFAKCRLSCWWMNQLRDNFWKRDSLSSKILVVSLKWLPSADVLVLYGLQGYVRFATIVVKHLLVGIVTVMGSMSPPLEPNSSCQKSHIVAHDIVSLSRVSLQTSRVAGHHANISSPSLPAATISPLLCM